MVLYKKGIKLNLTAKRSIMGYVFVLPFIIGIITFFFYPVMQSLIFSFSRLELSENGYTLFPVGFLNYNNALNLNPDFRKQLVEAFQNMITGVPLIIIFSFFAANLLNQKFRGRATARAIFFLPVILSSGIMISIANGDLIQSAMGLVGSGTGANGSSNITQNAQLGFGSEYLFIFMVSSKLSPQLIGLIIGAIDKIPTIVGASGVQILIFLAGLQSISPSLFEASNIEGATGWENFWKITFPMISPLILVNTIYSIIDAFTNSSNKIIQLIKDTAFKENNYCYSAAFSWIYFIAIFLVLSLVVWTISKMVFYQE